MDNRLLSILGTVALFSLVGCGGGSGGGSNASEPFIGICEFDAYFIGLEEVSSEGADALDDCFAINDDFGRCVGADNRDRKFCSSVGDDSFTLCSNIASLVVLPNCRAEVLDDTAVQNCIDSASHAYGDPASCTFIGFKRCDEAFAIELESCVDGADYVEQECLIDETGDAGDAATYECFDGFVAERTSCFQRAAFAHNVAGADDCAAVAGEPTAP